MAAEPLTDDSSGAARTRSGTAGSGTGGGAARGTERHPDLDAALADDDRFARLSTRGRRSGASRAVTVGFVGGPDGSIVVAAGAPETAWANNLLAEPAVEVTILGRSFAALAEPLDEGDPRRGAAVRDLILRYGTPSEGLGSGPIFILRPIPDEG